MSDEEFYKFVKLGTKNKHFASNSKHLFTETDKAILKSLPQSIDWRMKGFVPAIKSQQSCGSCWAFGAISSLEGQYYNLTGKSLRLSEQNLVDCTYRSINHSGCDGGFPHEAFENMQKFDNGVNVESSYPYTAEYASSCGYKAAATDAKITGHVRIYDEIAMTNALATVGPVSICLDVSRNFGAYSSGIFYDELCKTEFGGHCVSLVGYGSENGQDYYILRNSWDIGWGDKGYMKISRNKANMCGVASYGSYPILAKSTSTTRQNTEPTTTKKNTEPVTTSNPIDPTLFNGNNRGLTAFNISFFKGYNVSRIKTLFLEHNQITTLKINQLAKFTSLERLMLFDNQIKTLEDGWTNGLKNLKELDLNNNQLSTLKASNFKGLSSLKSLHLCYNNFKFISSDNAPFTSIPGLKYLDLTGNSLSNSIGPNSFKNLTKLEILWIGQCDITEINSEAFKNAFCSAAPINTEIKIAANPIVDTNSASLVNSECYHFNTDA